MEQNMRNLVAVSIIEKDVNGDVMLTWSYPELDPEQETVLINRSGFKARDDQTGPNAPVPLQYSFSKFKQEWIYSRVHITNNHKNIAAFSVSLLTTDYNPEKYAELCRIMCELYNNSDCSPIKLLECWLVVFARGSYRNEELAVQFKSDQYDIRASYLATSIKDVVNMFGEEIILLWSALMTKKRVVVFSEKLGILLKLIRCFPLFVWHRQQWELLRPFMTLDDVELKDIKNTGIYIAGFTDESVRDREDLYDVFVDVNNRSISVASHAKKDFLMTTVHKDVCDFLVKNSENPETSDQDVIKGLHQKTKDLIAKLETLQVEAEDGSGSYIDLETLKNTKLPANLGGFLYGVARAEGMTK